MKRTAKPTVAIQEWNPLTILGQLSEPLLTALPAQPLIDSLPYILYSSNASFEPSFISPNSKDFFGVPAEQFVGNSGIWKEIIPADDQEKVFEKFREVDHAGEISFIHRMVDRRGMRIWVSHRVKVSVSDGFRGFCGFIVPFASNELSNLLEPSAISSFVHKLGNHFQLLNLALNSLRKGGTDTQETDVVQETLDKAIALTRAFSEFSQAPAWVSAFEFLEIVDTAIASRCAAFIDHRIEVEKDFDPRLTGVTISGDPYLIELAIGAILQNAVDASTDRQNIKVRASLEIRGGIHAAVKLLVVDHGAGIKKSNLPKVTLPFFSTKSNHDGLGLSMAARFVELHRGNLEINSEIGKGTEVQVLLPLNGDLDDACR